MNDKTTQIDEFDASFGDPSKIPGPVTTKSSKRPADKDVGEKATPKLSRAHMMAAVVQHMSSLSHGDASAAYKSMFGKNAPNNASKNAATIKGMKEDVGEMFDGQEFSEDFMDNATTIVEALVSSRVLAEQARIEEESTEKLEAAILEAKEEMNEKVETYTKYVAEKWLEENEVAIESSLKVEMAEGMLKDIVALVEKYNITVAEADVDVVAESEEKLEKATADLEAAIAENIELKGEQLTLKKAQVFDTVSEGLTDTETEKFATMVSGIDAVDTDEYAQKLSVVKEQYFSTKAVIKEETEEEELDEGVKENNSAVDPSVAKIAEGISRSMKT